MRKFSFVSIYDSLLLSFCFCRELCSGKFVGQVWQVFSLLKLRGVRASVDGDGNGRREMGKFMSALDTSEIAACF